MNDLCNGRDAPHGCSDDLSRRDGGATNERLRLKPGANESGIRGEGISLWPCGKKNNTLKRVKNNRHRGSNFRAFLEAEGVLAEVEERAMKEAVALQLAALLKQRELTKSEMAVRMKTSRAAVDRLLDASNPSVTLATLGKAARALGRKVKIELVPA